MGLAVRDGAERMSDCDLCADCITAKLLQTVRNIGGTHPDTLLNCFNGKAHHGRIGRRKDVTKWTVAEKSGAAFVCPVYGGFQNRLVHSLGICTRGCKVRLPTYPQECLRPRLPRMGD